MKARLILPIFFAALALPVLGQETEAPTPPRPTLELGVPPPDPAPTAPSRADPALDLMPAQPGQLLPPSATQEPPLIPENPTSREKPRTKAERKSKTEAVEEAMAERVRLRQARTRAQADPNQETLWDTANSAPTDQEKRALLKQYYTQLYTRIRKLDPRLKTIATENERLAINHLKQARLSPSEPLDAAGRSKSPILSADLADF